MVEIDLSLKNTAIYRGVKIESFGGRKSFEVNQENLDIIGNNIYNYMQGLKAEFKAEGRDMTEFNKVITLTGATAIPVYLVAFHIVVHSFHEIRYKNEMYDIIAAKH
ncbi:hypothetical protein ACMCNP_03870 [Candidatus Acidulodesulfobacterium sp. H_13]|uniref:hypothetical protein n=1 Tax=Candidatus Acidulodesulfobacterium sp. H_13 TaxID=3395470 RepID=UPI003AF5C002